jgi:phosphohistidine phosphatase SixA
MKQIILTGHSPTVEETAKTMGVSRTEMKKIVKTMGEIIRGSKKSTRASASRRKMKK